MYQPYKSMNATTYAETGSNQTMRVHGQDGEQGLYPSLCKQSVVKSRMHLAEGTNEA